MSVICRNPATASSWFLASLGLLAFLAGFAALRLTVDVPADGPYRAMMAYTWLQNPYAAKCGTWLPAPTYLNGLFLLVVPDPLVSTRIFNLILGSATVPIYYLLAKCVFGRSVAAVSAIMLLVLPLRIGLSASSLTESGFLFELVTGIWLLIVAADTEPPRKLALIGSLAFLVLAGMTRYEAWLLIPVFPAFFFIRTRQLGLSSIIALVLLTFPLLWMAGNHYCFDDALKGFRAATSEERYAEAVGLSGGVTVLGTRMLQQMGIVLPFFILVGVWHQGIRLWRRTDLQPERILYLTLTVIVWAVLLKFVMARGPGSFQTRYMLLAMVLALPFAVLPFQTVLAPCRAVVGLACLFAVTELAAGRGVAATWMPDLWLVQKRPGDAVDSMAELAAWIASSPYRDRALLTTPLKVDEGWAANYLPLYLPALSGRIRTLSYWLRDEDIAEFVEQHRPVLLATGDADIDREELMRATRLLGARLAIDHPVHESSSGLPVRLYRIDER